jgi:hypothetical protein
MVVRDAVDIVPLVVAHHLRVGIERIHVIDDGSSDGTSEALTDLARRSGRVTHHRVLVQDDPQLETVSDASNRLIADGARLVVPFDADEFWDLTPEILTSWVRDERPRSLGSHWVNFAQARTHTYPRSGGLLAVSHRADPDPAASAEEVSSFRASFLHYGPIPKVAVWSREPVAFARGQHHVLLAGDGVPLTEEPAGVDVLHVPLRWQSELTKRAFNYEPRRARLRVNTGDSWQSLFHLRVMQEHREDDVWAANSVDASGHLDVYGHRVALIGDARVQQAVRAAGALLQQWGVPVP